ncbi:carbohydrate ABC transporter substrate-binding protein, CUT1 family (TC 3.A.1.1.-) [Garciella nitratireducens DSM 15102]|uniref:Carbohydrate ABC transporter substrate-binding protein, CUT1 family (TC 3.A.1.1.-) n=2 Tax=Garciella TaxID=218204 RepID=A0A1T4K8T1_9FIRM|nr:arabinogalactan oligomer/maltooligosaccharide transport system substrate-binding protein [Garciella nitratireducens]SJZ38757.1 carbohydrate ABC transporter substrate-binding protein, CUT1 family (TC 3.A.1.1.-) [Garciella nitratireducens DSM 15102]
MEDKKLYFLNLGGGKMKKVIALLLVLFLSLSIVGCSGGKSKDAISESNEIKETITVQVEKDWLAYYEKAAERVKEQYPKANIKFITTGAFDHLDVLDATDVTNKDVADVFAIPADRIYGLEQNEALAAIDAKTMAKNVGGFSNYDEGLGGNFKIGEDYLAFPMNIETLIVFANTANAKEKGINLKKPIEFTELDVKDMLIPVFDAWYGVALTNSAEIELLGKDKSGNLYSDLTANFNELPKQKQEVMKALFNYWKGHNRAKTSLWDEDAAGGYMDTAFSSGGESSLRLEGPWAIGSLSNLTNNGKDLEILPINTITINGNPLSHWQGGWGLAINSRVEDNEAKMMLAQKFIEEVVNPKYAVEFFKATGKILENVPVSIYENSDLSETDKKVIKAVIESYENAPARPLFIEWGSVWDTWKNAILSWPNTKPATVEDAYKEIKASFDAMMQNF